MDLTIQPGQKDAGDRWPLWQFVAVCYGRIWYNSIQPIWEGVKCRSRENKMGIANKHAENGITVTKIWENSQAVRVVKRGYPVRNPVGKTHGAYLYIMGRSVTIRISPRRLLPGDTNNTCGKIDYKKWTRINGIYERYTTNKTNFGCSWSCIRKHW